MSPVAEKIAGVKHSFPVAISPLEIATPCFKGDPYGHGAIPIKISSTYRSYFQEFFLSILVLSQQVFSLGLGTCSIAKDKRPSPFLLHFHLMALSSAVYAQNNQKAKDHIKHWS